MENPIKMDDLGIPLFLETPICHNYELLPTLLSTRGFLKKTVFQRVLFEGKGVME